MIGRSGQSGSGISVLAVRHDDDDIFIAFALSFLCLWNQIPWRNLRIIVLLQDILHVPTSMIQQKSVLIFPLNILEFRSDTIEKQGVRNLSSYSSKIYTSVVLCDSEVTFLRERRMQHFVHFSIAFGFYTALHNRRNTFKNFLVFLTSGGILLRLSAFLF